MPNGRTLGSPLETSIPAGIAQIGALLDWMDQHLKGREVPDTLRRHVLLAVEEIAVNASVHGKIPADDGRINAKLQAGPEAARVELAYGGEAFDPTGSEVPPEHAPETPGGHGLALVRAYTSGFSYRRDGARNLVTLEFGSIENRPDPG